MVTTHEVIHTTHSSGKKGMILKIDYEKVYDRANLDFVYEVLELRGFGRKWINWIKSITQQGSTGVKINGEESDFFITSSGLRQGGPFSPLLFNLVVDVFAKMIVKGSQLDWLEDYVLISALVGLPVYNMQMILCCLLIMILELLSISNGF